MRVFVTGATGHVGSAVVPELLKAGHQIIGLARSDASAASLEKRGVEVVRGGLDDLDRLHGAARQADGVIHLAYRHDLAFGGSPDGFLQAAEIDLGVVRTFGDALAGSGKPLVMTTGTALLALPGPGKSVTETDILSRGPRIDCENLAVGFETQGVRASVIRLAPTVHSELDQHGFLAMLVQLARRQGFVGYIGAGENVWNAVNTFDAAGLYRLALESSPAGKRWHAVAESAIPYRLIAQTIARRLGVPVRSLSPEEAPGYFGGFLNFAAMNCPASSDRTRTELGWQPTNKTLLEDLADEHYFRQR